MGAVESKLRKPKPAEYAKVPSGPVPDAAASDADTDAEGPDARFHVADSCDEYYDDDDGDDGDGEASEPLPSYRDDASYKDEDGRGGDERYKDRDGGGTGKAG